MGSRLVDHPALTTLADLAGVERGYWDVQGRWHDATAESAVAVLRVLGHELTGPADAERAVRDLLGARAAEPLPRVVVAWQGRPLELPVRFAGGAHTGRLDVVVHLEGGGDVAITGGEVDPARGRRDDDVPGATLVDVTVDLPPLPSGYHELVVHHPAGGPVHRPLIVAPRRARALAATERLWGVFAPLYALRTEDPFGPSVTDLDRLGAWLDERGGKVVGTLPILAAFLDEPFDPSPYAPVSRRFWNEEYVDLGRLPAPLGPAGGRLDHAEVRAAFAALDAAPAFDHRAQHLLRRRLLEVACVGHDDTDLATLAGFDPEVSSYARFRAMGEATGTGWHTWPSPARAGELRDADLDPAAVRFHEVAQHVMRRQIAAVGASFAERGQRLYLDLPVGTNGDGYDTWRNPELFAWGAAAGAPPDDFFTGGQNWGFPPLVPAASSAEVHRHLRAVLHHHMAVAGVLRLDHVMGLFRMYWVPDGAEATDGVYVRYPFDELLAVLTIESHRHDCVVVGEDLGTVPDEVRAAMAEHDLLGMYVAEFAVDEAPDAPLALPDARQLASVDTHDTATFAAWVRDDERAPQVVHLLAALAAAGTYEGDLDAARRSPTTVLEGLLRVLGDSPSPVVLLALEDLWAETEPQNVPGTPADRPNWVHRFPRSLDELGADPTVRRVLGALQGCRLGAHLSAKEDPS